MLEIRRDAFLFFLSTLVLSFVLGFAVRERQWFPSDQLRRAALQASRLNSPPPYVVPRVYHRSGVHAPRPSDVGEGFTLISSFWPEYDWGTGLKLIDGKGRTLHSWRVNPSEIFDEGHSAGPVMYGRVWDNLSMQERSVHGAHLFPNGDVIANLSYVGTVRLDACSNTIWVLDELSHHSVERGEDGTFWISAGSRSAPSRSERNWEIPGLEGPLFHDRILQVTEDGEILRDIHLLEVLYENGLEHLVFRAGFNTGAVNGDLTHLNDVEPLDSDLAGGFSQFEAGDLLISVRNLNLVLVLDPETTRAKWHTTEPFLRQHDPDFLPSGWIGIFDNRSDFTRRGSFLGGSRIVAVQPSVDSTQMLFPAAGSNPFYTRHMGKWQKLPNGNLLLTESQAGRIVEVTSAGQVVWEWIQEPYEENWVAEVAEGERYELSSERIRAWPCSE